MTKLVFANDFCSSSIHILNHKIEFRFFFTSCNFYKTTFIDNLRLTFSPIPPACLQNVEQDSILVSLASHVRRVLDIRINLSQLTTIHNRDKERTVLILVLINWLKIVSVKKLLY